MPTTYHVSFFKRLTDSTGHRVDALQGAVDIRASCEDQAVKRGRQRFAELKDVGTWTLRADYETVAPKRRPVVSGR